MFQIFLTLAIQWKVNATWLWETPNFQRFSGRKTKKKDCFSAWHLFLSVFLKWEVSLLDWIKMADLSAQHPQSTQLWRALLFLSSASHCCWDQSTPVKACLWWKCTHRKAYMTATCRHSLAHSECCCLGGLCLGPGVTSSLCLCCRWCTSSLGYPSFCWPGTSLLFLPPVKIRKETAHICKWKQMETSRVQSIWSIFIFSSHIADNKCNANHMPMGNTTMHLPPLYSQQNQI